MSAQPYLVVIPVRGLHLTDTTLPATLFDRPWTLVGHNQMNALENLHGPTSSLHGNIREIRQRLWPTAFLLVRYYEGQQRSVWDEYRAERMLAAISMAILLKPWAANGSIANPRPVFRARYPEACDLPLSFHPGGIRSVGHTTRLGLLSPGSVSSDRRLSVAELEAWISRCPAVIQKVLADERLNKREDRLADSMMAITAAWQNLTPGGFIASLVSATESLVDSQASDAPTEQDRSWKTRVQRINTVVGESFADQIKAVLQVRHNYVHAAKQPDSDALTFSALAMALQCWAVMHALYEKYGDVQDVEAYLDCCSLAKRVKSAGLEPLRSLHEAMPPGPRAELAWVDSYLSPAQPQST